MGGNCPPCTPSLAGKKYVIVGRRTGMPYKDVDKQRAYQKEWIAARRRLWFRNKLCARCGSTDNLELDHIDPNHKVTHRIWSYSWSNIAIETAKCQVLCHDCHWKKTRDEDMKYEGLKHGTTNGYDHYGCRCRECKDAHNAYTNEWRYRTGRRKKSAWGTAIHFSAVKVVGKRLEIVDKI